MSTWNIVGDYAETCNCNMLCPCISSNMEAVPTENDCKAAIAMRINKGAKDGVKLDGLSFVVMLYSPGPMIQGNLKVGLIVDEKASDAQLEAIKAIATGEAGGPMAALAPLVGEIAGLERQPIDFSGSGLQWAVKAGGLLDQKIAGVPAMHDNTQPLYIDNVGHPVNSRLALGRAVKSMFNAFGIKWNDSTGTRNGHFASFAWSS